MTNNHHKNYLNNRLIYVYDDGIIQDGLFWKGENDSESKIIS